MFLVLVVFKTQEDTERSKFVFPFSFFPPSSKEVKILKK